MWTTLSASRLWPSRECSSLWTHIHSHSVTCDPICLLHVVIQQYCSALFTTDTFKATLKYLNDSVCSKTVAQKRLQFSLPVPILVKTLGIFLHGLVKKYTSLLDQHPICFRIKRNWQLKIPSNSRVQPPLTQMILISQNYSVYHISSLSCQFSLLKQKLAFKIIIVASGNFGTDWSKFNLRLSI